MSDDHQNALKIFAKLVSFRSISLSAEYHDDMDKTVHFLQKLLSEAGFSVKLIDNIHRPHAPLIIATYTPSSFTHTIGIYGHYDVQPAGNEAEWNSKPFQFDERDGTFFGRGVADNKGHIVQNITACKQLISERELKNRIVFILEGEEEAGSSGLETMLKSESEILSACDVFLVTDTEMYAKGVPQIISSLRGLVYFELILSAGKRDLHSGVYGNAAPDANIHMFRLLSKMVDESSGRIRIPDFYHDVRRYSSDELYHFARFSPEDAVLQSEMETFGVQKIDGISKVHLATTLLPSFTVHGIESGYTGPGEKTVLPHESRVKFSFRLVADQKASDIQQKVIRFIAKNVSDCMKYTLQTLSATDPFSADFTQQWTKKVSRILADHFGQETVIGRSGGSIPVAEILQRLFGKPIVLTGFTLSDDHIHGPNENMDADMFWEGIKVLKKIYSA